MAALPESLTLARVLNESVTWRLLRADLAPVIVAILSTRFTNDELRVDAEEFAELCDIDLDELRAHGFELPGNGRGYAAEWRAKGYLVRRPAESARGETLELSPAAHEAIRFLAQLTKPRQAVTESRLSSIAQQLRQLALDSDPDQDRRLKALYAERDRIDAKIAAVSRGDLPIIDENRAAERMRDIVSQAADLPTDFARVREQFESLNRDLRARIIASDADQRGVLDEIFRGVDLIAESEAGRSFSGFANTLLDPEIGEAFDNDIQRVLGRSYAQGMHSEDRRFLRHLTRMMKDRSAEIHQVITTFARGLRRFVQSQDYQRDRVLRQELRETFALGHETTAHTKPYRLTELTLDLAAVPITSAGALRLHDPSEYDASETVVEYQASAVDLEALRLIARETEIDFTELIANVNSQLSGNETVTIAEVLAAAPATQGVASVVGLLSLGALHGELGTELDRLDWIGGDGVPRYTHAPRYRFTGRISQE